MKIKRFKWGDPMATAAEVRLWAIQAWPDVDIDDIEYAVRKGKNRDKEILSLTAKFDATQVTPKTLRVPEEEKAEALYALNPDLSKSLKLAADNIRKVAETQVERDPRKVELPQGHSVTTREVPVGAAGIYAPGGRAAYPSSVLMCSIPARVAGVPRIALATPPGPDGKVNPVVLAAAALCEIDEVYAMGGAQAIFALAYGTESIEAVDVVAGPGNAWVRQAKARVAGIVTIDSLAGPSELMVIADRGTHADWIALDLCAQAEHGDETPLIVVSTDQGILERIAQETKSAAARQPTVANAQLALVTVPNKTAAIDFANAFAPEHLQLMVKNPAKMAARVMTAGCVLAGEQSATAFGDYAAGSNHVLPTSGAGHFSGPLGPGTFRRKISTVEIPAEAAAKLAPHVDTIARAEGFPVHGESAMIRSKTDE